MRPAILLAAVVVLALAAESRGDTAKEDGKVLEGTWLPVEGELSGQKFPDEVLKTMKLVLKDGAYTAEVGAQVDRGTYRLDPAKKPRAMDITSTEGPNKGNTLLAIYELAGDTLRVCYDLEGKTRPTEFKTGPKSKRFLVTYKRNKP